MKIDELRLFAAVARAGGMSQAASQLGLSQPNVSRAVRGLEDTLGVSLVTRTGRGVELTASGERFMAFASETVQRYEQVREDVRKLDGSLPSRLSISIPRHTGRLLMPAIYRAFHEKLPDVFLEVTERQALDSSAALADRACDVAVFYDNATSPFPERRRLFSEQLYMTGHKRHLGTGSEPITLAECAGLPLLMFSNPPYARLIEGAFAKAKLSPRIARRVENKVAMVAFAMEGEGVAVQAFSNLVNEYENREIQARLIADPPIEREILVAFGNHVERRFANAVFRLLKASLNAVAPTARWCKV
ncbi:LysR family transcriptional regulator [Bauldia sp.]|uniref:LysR family transcriptional regulator n=1 Tax=Bauldia sp. TaxID=2575872 RepID=UPI003BAA7EE0